MTRTRNNGVISGSSRRDKQALIVDAMGGGLCKTHGGYYGHGKHGLRDCPYCDIDEFYKKSKAKGKGNFEQKDPNCIVNGKPVAREHHEAAIEGVHTTDLRTAIKPAETESVIDWSPLVNNQLFDLDIAASGNNLKPEKLAEFQRFLKENRNKVVRLYHATDEKIPILKEGLKPTGKKTATSLGTSFGRVSLGYDPRQVIAFPDLGYPYAKKINIYAVEIPIRNLIPDTDQLRNRRLYGGKQDIGNSLAESLIYGHGAQVKGKIPSSQIRLYGVYDKGTKQTEICCIR